MHIVTTYLFSICVFQAIISLIPAFLLIGIAWNLTLLYSGLFLYSFGKQFCINSVCIQMHYYYYHPNKNVLVFFALVFQFVIMNVFIFAAAAIVVPCLSTQVSEHGGVFLFVCFLSALRLIFISYPFCSFFERTLLKRIVHLKMKM